MVLMYGVLIVNDSSTPLRQAVSSSTESDSWPARAFGAEHVFERFHPFGGFCRVYVAAGLNLVVNLRHEPRLES